MEIKPLCPELIAKLEIAVAHKNRERAVAVVERYFAKLNNPRVTALDTPLAEILPMRQASLLAKEGYMYLRDLKELTEPEILSIKNAGKKLVEALRSAIKTHLQTTNTN
jgi:hypothetical protein